MTIKLDKQGLVPSIIQDINTKEVLMLGYVSPGSFRRTVEGGGVEFYSRSREDLWHKGEISGNFLHMRKVFQDCDGDALIFQVESDGPTCHTGNISCFFTTVEDSQPDFANSESGSGILDELFALIQERKKELPEGSYTADLLKAGVGRAGQKVVEEAGEVAIAAAQGDVDQVTSEVADLLYHVLVLIAASGTTPEAVWSELRSRRH
tara:strand:- start:376 stop:996 length:621 start_codon:yes stop_codon:yes gene_type:complete